MQSNKICLVTWYDSINYGTVIQCAALNYYLKSLGFDVIVPDRFRYLPLCEYREILRKIIKKIKYLFQKDYEVINRADLSTEVQAGYDERYENVKAFISNELTLIKMQSNKSYLDLNQVADIFITGSDQIWNPNHLSNQMLLNFVDDKKLKIAYGSSIGVNTIPSQLKKEYKKYLSRFDNIGVREKDAVGLLEELLPEKKIINVLDPTFLLNANDYDVFVNKSSIKKGLTHQDQFIVCYFIGKNKSWYKDVQLVAKEKGLRIIICLSESNIVPDFGEIYPEAGPYEFLWLLKYSKYIFTDSFHATALGINMNKEIVVYKRFEDTDKKSQNSRISNLLDMFSLSNRLISNTNHISNIANNSIDYTEVNKVLAKERRKSVSFLNESLVSKR